VTGGDFDLRAERFDAVPGVGREGHMRKPPDGLREADSWGIMSLPGEPDPPLVMPPAVPAARG
jgi:hypothetical protein